VNVILKGTFLCENTPYNVNIDPDF